MKEDNKLRSRDKIHTTKKLNKMTSSKISDHNLYFQRVCKRRAREDKVILLLQYIIKADRSFASLKLLLCPPFYTLKSSLNIQLEIGI
jgi:hypothetical protein